METWHWMWEQQSIFQLQVLKWILKAFADALKGLLRNRSSKFLVLLKNLLSSEHSWATGYRWHVLQDQNPQDGTEQGATQCISSHQSSATCSSGRWTFHQRKSDEMSCSDFLSSHCSFKAACCSKWNQRKKRYRPFLFRFSRLTLLRRSRVSFSLCWYSRSFLYLQMAQRRWMSMVSPSNCIVICTIMHNICFTVQQNMNLEKAQSFLYTWALIFCHWSWE